MTLDDLTLDPHWWWLVAALVLGIAEIVVPGFFLIWLAAAAALVGVLTFVLDLGLVAQAIAFALAALAAVYAGRRWLLAHPVEPSDPLLNNRAARLIGEIVTVVDAIEAGRGRVRVGDGVWNASGPDMTSGNRARIVGAEGTLLLIEPL